MKKIFLKLKYIEFNFRNKVDILSWMFLIGVVKNRSSVLKIYDFVFKKIKLNILMSYLFKFGKLVFLFFG